MGFGVPLAAWFRGPLREMVHDVLLSQRMDGRGLVSREFVSHLLSEHERGRRDNHYWLWLLFMLELWYRHAESPAGAAMPA